MQSQKSFKTENSGQLYLVPTPIGNLEDMTYRAVNVLNMADLIASEDTRNTQKLLNHFEIKTPQRSLHEHNFKERIPELLELLMQGKTIAQVSDAGMPSISDPGHELVLACIEQAIPVIALPGASAGITAVIASGLTPQPFFFYGFLARKKTAQKKELTELATQTGTLIFYESPYRVKETLTTIQAIFGDRQAVICRELTKVYEEYLRGSISELVAYLNENTIKGECCLLIAGASKEQPKPTGSLLEQVQEAITAGKTSKEAIKEVAKLNGIKKQVVYNAYHGIEEK